MLREKKPELLVVIPHSGLFIPAEIPLESLGADFPILAGNIDWYTNWLYDFRDLLANRQLVFPFCSLILEANRDPEVIDAAVPLFDIHNRPVYREGWEPSRQIRRSMADKYLRSFYEAIEESILTGAGFLFEGHSTVSARGVAPDQIEIMNFQHSPMDEKPRFFCPDKLVQDYAAELGKRLPEARVTVNSSSYYQVYGHICSAYSGNGLASQGKKVPALIQETSELLYKNPDQTVNVMALNRLRQAFAESIQVVLSGLWKDL